MNLFLILAAVIPAVFLLVQVYRADRLEKEPVSLLLSLLLWGTGWRKDYYYRRINVTNDTGSEGPFSFTCEKNRKNLLCKFSHLSISPPMVK